MICTKCGATHDNPAPAGWVENHPGLAGLCPACVVEYIDEHCDEVR